MFQVPSTTTFVALIVEFEQVKHVMLNHQFIEMPHILQ